jgi:hypothetical protein
MNIRNAYLAEEPATLLNTFSEMVADGRTEEAGYVRELLFEVMDESLDAAKAKRRSEVYPHSSF